VTVAARLPEDREATDRAWRQGVGLGEAAPGSPLWRALAELTAALLGTADRDAGRPRRRLARRGRVAG
jgi:Flp pilus assembly CpaE family ATPase